MALAGSQNLKRKLDTAGLDVKDDDRRDRCYKCGGRGHLQKECPTDPKTGNELSCYKCQGKGHFARNCPNLSRDVCYFCGQMGHHGLDCPMLTRMFGNLPPIKRKELMAKMHSNPQFQSQIMREAGAMSAYTDPYGLAASANPLQALMTLLQTNPAAAAAQLGLTAGAQPALYANPYNQAQAPPAYPGYGDASSQGMYISASQSAYSAYGIPGSPGGAGSSSSHTQSGAATYSAPPSMYGAAQPSAANPFAGAAPGGDVLSTLRALSGAGSFGAPPGGSAYPGLGGLYGSAAPPGGLGAHGGGSNCYKCGQAGHFARECPNAPADGGPLCYRCGTSGHMAKDCTNPPTAGSVAGNESCFRCGERGHFSRDCIKNGAIPSKDSCFRCGQPGHRTRECAGPDIRVCFVCKQSGHVSSACPERAAR